MSTCVDLSFVKFGTCKNPESTLSVNVNSISKNVSDTIMNSVTSTNTDVIVVQNQNVNIIGSCCSPLKVSQEANLKVLESNSINVSMVTNILNQMRDGYSKDLDKVQPALDKITGENLGKNITTSIKQSMTKLMQDESVQNSLREKLVSVIASQNQNVQVNCSEYIPIPSNKDGSCTITQEFLLQLEINNVFEDIFSKVIVDPNVVDAINAYTENSLVYTQSMIQGEFVPFWKGEEKRVMSILGIILVIIILRKIILMLIK